MNVYKRNKMMDYLKKDRKKVLFSRSLNYYTIRSQEKCNHIFSGLDK